MAKDHFFRETTIKHLGASIPGTESLITTISSAIPLSLNLREFSALRGATTISSDIIRFVLFNCTYHKYTVILYIISIL